MLYPPDFMKQSVPRVKKFEVHGLTQSWRTWTYMLEVVSTITSPVHEKINLKIIIHVKKFFAYYNKSSNYYTCKIFFAYYNKSNN